MDTIIYEIELDNIYKYKSPCIGCQNELMDKDQCINNGCTKSAEWHDNQITSEIERRMLVLKVRNRGDGIDDHRVLNPNSNSIKRSE